MRTDWELVYDDPINGVRRYERDLDENTVVQRTQWYLADSFLAANKALRDASEGRPFGDGQVVASVPMHVWATELAKPIKDGDDAYIKRWINSYENQAYRTFRGKI